MSKLEETIETIIFSIGLLFALAWCKTSEAWCVLNESVHMRKSRFIMALFIVAVAGTLDEAIEYWTPPYFSNTLWYRFPISMYPAAHYRFFFILQHFFGEMKYIFIDTLKDCVDIYIEEVHELEGR